MDTRKSPIAGRLKRPTWTDPRLLIGIGMVIVSVIGTASIVGNADRTEPYYAARDTLTPGTVVALDDLTVVNVRVGGGEYVSDPTEVEGMVVTRVVGSGEMLPLSALADADRYVARSVAVTTTLPIGQDIERGAIVDVWVTTEGPAGPTSRRVATAVVVDEVSRDTGAFSGVGAETVYVLISESSVGVFLAELASDGDVAVVRVAGGK